MKKHAVCVLPKRKTDWNELEQSTIGTVWCCMLYVVCCGGEEAGAFAFITTPTHEFITYLSINVAVSVQTKNWNLAVVKITTFFFSRFCYVLFDLNINCLVVDIKSSSDSVRVVCYF